MNGPSTYRLPDCLDVTYPLSFCPAPTGRTSFDRVHGPFRRTATESIVEFDGVVTPAPSRHRTNRSRSRRVPQNVARSAGPVPTGRLSHRIPVLPRLIEVGASTPSASSAFAFVVRVRRRAPAAQRGSLVGIEDRALPVAGVERLGEVAGVGGDSVGVSRPRPPR